MAGTGTQPSDRKDARGPLTMKTAVNNPLAFRDEYLNKYFQNCSEFIQFIITVFLLEPRKFAKLKMCLLRRGKRHFVLLCVCLLTRHASRFEFFTLHSSFFSLHDTLLSPSSPLSPLLQV